MSSILYNTNSSFIQRYQRNNLRQNRFTQSNYINKGQSSSGTGGLPSGEPFTSKYEKDTPKYLEELCTSCFPTSLHQRIHNLKVSPDLEIIALASLVYKNFISTWYGPKIPTKDDQFPTEVFNLIERLISFFRQSNIDFKTVILDEYAVLLSNHINAIRALNDATEYRHVFYEKYCQLTLYDEETYPYIITALVQESLHSDSTLQNTFIDGMFNELLLGRTFDSLSEPYYLLRGISKLCSKLIQGKLKKQNPKRLSYWGNFKAKINTLIKGINYVSSVNSRIGISPSTPLTGRYIFHTLFVDLFQLEIKKPLLYYTLRCFKELSTWSSIFSNISNNAVDNIIQKKVTNNPAISSYFRLIRHTMFPSDNLMGPRTIIPTGEEFEAFKKERVSEISAVLELYNISGLLSVSKDQVSDFVECISISQKCNKLLFFRLIDCLLAHVVSSDEHNSI